MSAGLVERADPERIYLEPGPDFCPNTGRQWCEDDVWPLEGDGPSGIPYVRAAALEAAQARIAELEAQLKGARAQIEADRDTFRDADIINDPIGAAAQMESAFRNCQRALAARKEPSE